MKHRETNGEYIAQRITVGEFPRYLYKYRQLYTGKPGEELVSYTTNILTNAEVWHGSPTTFNDPFDCRIELDERYRDSIIRSTAKLLQTPQEAAPGNRKIRREHLRNLKSNPRQIVARMQHHVRNALEAIGLCSYGIEGEVV